MVTNQGKYQQAVSPTGVGWNKHFTYYLTNEAPVGAGLCLGQRDLFPSYYGFNVTDLARQVNTGELANPMKLLTGNFDLSYVFVFLFPLLIVALFYDLFAGEKEGGTLALLLSQSTTLTKILIGKAMTRLVIVWILATLLLIFGFHIQDISFAGDATLFFEWLLIVLVYSLLWTVIMIGFVYMRRGAALTAMLGLGFWLIFTIVTPAFINLFVLANEPLPNRSEMIHSVRDLNDQNWEKPRAFVFDQFYLEYPEYNDGDTTDFDKWYYASFTVLDKEASLLKEKYEEQIDNRNDLLESWEWVAPAAMVHELLSRKSQTDRKSHAEFIDAVYAYHQELKGLYYDKIFKGGQFSAEDLKMLSESL